jgi:transcriptional regulator with XRE-family HTH domain
MQGNVSEIIRELMAAQQLSVRKVSARIAEKHGGSIYGYTQQISRILNDPDYDPTLTTVQKILSALNVSLWQINQQSTPNYPLELQYLATRLDQLSNDVADLRLGLAELQKSVTVLLSTLIVRSPD